MEYLLELMEISILVIGKMINSMDLEKASKKMEIFMKVNGEMTKEKEEENTFGMIKMFI